MYDNGIITNQNVKKRVLSSYRFLVNVNKIYTNNLNDLNRFKLIKKLIRYSKFSKATKSQFFKRSGNLTKILSGYKKKLFHIFFKTLV